MAHRDPEANRAYKRAWYQKNKKRVKANVRRNNARYRLESQLYVQALKTKTACADCKRRFHHSAMDFDHVVGSKESNISLLVNTAYSLKKVKREIAKCEIVCANCHRVRTWHRAHKAG